jgi:hypothetical protein
VAICAAFYGFDQAGRAARPTIRRHLERLGKLRMADIADTIRPAPANARTVQEYIDEVPAWADGTEVK